MIIPRRTLKNRRPNSSVTVEWHGQSFELTVGFYDDGQIGEIFAGGGKTPQDIQQLVADACVLISIALQYGVSIQALGRSLARHEDGKPYTIIGIICDVVATYEEKEKRHD